MGALSKLKIKTEIRYRKGSTNEAQNCRACKHFRKDWYQFKNNPNGADIIESRCDVIGLREGSRYRVREDNTCDRQVISEAYSEQIKRWIGSGLNDCITRNP